MKLTYTLKAEDFLEFNLYTASKSEALQKKSKRGMIFMLVFILIMSVYIIADQKYTMLFYSAALIVTVLFFYKKYFKWTTKRHYKKYIKKTHEAQIDQIETLEFKSKSIFIKNNVGEGSIANNEVVQVNETNNLYMILLTSGTSLVIPKRELSETTSFLAQIEKMKLKVNPELDWKW